MASPPSPSTARGDFGNLLLTFPDLPRHSSVSGSTRQMPRAVVGWWKTRLDGCRHDGGWDWRPAVRDRTEFADLLLPSNAR